MPNLRMLTDQEIKAAARFACEIMKHPMFGRFPSRPLVMHPEVAPNMRADVAKEIELCRQRRLEIGEEEHQRLLALRDEAQRLCYSLCVQHKRTQRIERVLRLAEDRRERRGLALWPWCSYVDRTGKVISS